MSSISSSQLYREAVDRLSQAGIANAKREALWIVEEVLGVDRLHIHAHGGDLIDSEQCLHASFLSIERRVLHVNRCNMC